MTLNGVRAFRLVMVYAAVSVVLPLIDIGLSKYPGAPSAIGRAIASLAGPISGLSLILEHILYPMPWFTYADDVVFFLIYLVYSISCLTLIYLFLDLRNLSRWACLAAAIAIWFSAHLTFGYLLLAGAKSLI